MATDLKSGVTYTMPSYTATFSTNANNGTPHEGSTFFNIGNDAFYVSPNVRSSADFLWDVKNNKKTTF
jgi:uncharacterized protein YchJ